MWKLDVTSHGLQRKLVLVKVVIFYVMLELLMRISWLKDLEIGVPRFGF